MNIKELESALIVFKRVNQLQPNTKVVIDLYGTKYHVGKIQEVYKEGVSTLVLVVDKEI